VQDLHFRTPFELRGLFALLTTHEYPTKKIFNDETLRAAMMEDHFIRLHQNRALAENQLLIDLQRLLSNEGCTLEQFGLPTPTNTKTELEYEKLKYDCAQQQQLLIKLNQESPNNELQQIAFNEIMAAVDNPKPLNNFYFINGQGGTGKTTLCKKLHAAIRAKGKIVKVCASTTLAATLYDDAMTAHSLFKYPVVEEEDKDMENPAECRLVGMERLELLKQTSVIFWDEFVSNHRELFEAVQKALRDCPNIVFVCSGDFRQILPVITNGSADDVLAATISSSYYWQYFTILNLKQNMRLTALQTAITANTSPEVVKDIKRQIQYAESILAIGEGRDHPFSCILHDISKFPDLQQDHFVGLPMMKKYFVDYQKEEALQWLYPNLLWLHLCAFSLRQINQEMHGTKSFKISMIVHSKY
jgi:hypothetical protein